MSDVGVIEDLQKIKRKETALQRERAHRERDLEVAKEAQAAALAALSEEFGVTTVEEAEEELARRTEQFAQDVKAVVEQLKEVG
jgi:hypothetical protein